MTNLNDWIRVSQVLDILPSKDADDKWHFPLQKIDPEVLRRKAELGTNVHAAIAAHFGHSFYALSHREEGYFESFLKWYTLCQFPDSISEKRFFYEPMRLTGCVDLLLKNKEDGFLIIDFKCTQTADKLKWPLQGAFYAFLANQNGIKGIESCMFLQLKEDGSAPEAHLFPITKQLMTTAMSLYNTYVYLTKK